MAYIFVTGDIKVNAPIKIDNFIKQILRWIEFATKD